MRLKITHTTRYHYDEPVHYVLQQVRLTPEVARRARMSSRGDTMSMAARSSSSMTTITTTMSNW
jgi:hypothetical protein